MVSRTTTPVTMIDPLLLPLPNLVKTERLLLRVPQVGDGPALHSAICESLPELRQFLSASHWMVNPSTDVANLASRRMAERCLFALEGILRQERRANDGSLRNTCIYARLRPVP